MKKMMHVMLRRVVTFDYEKAELRILRGGFVIALVAFVRAISGEYDFDYELFAALIDGGVYVTIILAKSIVRWMHGFAKEVREEK